MHFSPFFSDKAVKIKPESFFWWKIVLICHIACSKWIKIVDFRGFLHFRAENPGFRVKILKLQFLQKGSMKNFKNCTKQTPTLYIFMGGMSCLCSWKKLISPQKPTVGIFTKTESSLPFSYFHFFILIWCRSWKNTNLLIIFIFFRTRGILKWCCILDNQT